MKTDGELHAFRRHLRACPFFGKGGRDVRADKCNCPFHVDGLHNGRRVRQALRTRSRQLADRRLAELSRKLDARLANQHGIENAAVSGQEAATAARLTVSDAAARFLKTHGEQMESTGVIQSVGPGRSTAVPFDSSPHSVKARG